MIPFFIRILFLCAILFTVSSYAQTPPVKFKKPEPVTVKLAITDSIFEKVKYTKVVAYNFRSTRAQGVMVENADHTIGTFHETVKLPGVTLTEMQVKTLIYTLTSKKTYGGGTAACFDPHMAFVFYDEKEIVKAYIDVCMDCNTLKAKPFIAVRKNYTKKHPLKEGFSEKGRKTFKKFCTDFNFEHCNKPSELFDK